MAEQEVAAQPYQLLTGMNTVAERATVNQTSTLFNETITEMHGDEQNPQLSRRLEDVESRHSTDVCMIKNAEQTTQLRQG